MKTEETDTGKEQICADCRKFNPRSDSALGLCVRGDRIVHVRRDAIDKPCMGDDFESKIPALMVSAYLHEKVWKDAQEMVGVIRETCDFLMSKARRDPHERDVVYKLKDILDKMSYEPMLCKTCRHWAPLGNETGICEGAGNPKSNDTDFCVCWNRKDC